MAVKALASIIMSRSRTDWENLLPKINGKRYLVEATAARLNKKIRQERMAVSVRSYLRLCFFLNEFFGKRTVKIDNEIKLNTLEILFAKENVPTSENVLESLIIPLLIANQLSPIIWEIPAG